MDKQYNSYFLFPGSDKSRIYVMLSKNNQMMFLSDINNIQQIYKTLNTDDNLTDSQQLLKNNLNWYISIRKYQLAEQPKKKQSTSKGKPMNMSQLSSTP